MARRIYPGFSLCLPLSLQSVVSANDFCSGDADVVSGSFWHWDVDEERYEEGSPGKESIVTAVCTIPPGAITSSAIMPIKDGKPKFKDFPTDFGGTHELVDEDIEQPAAVVVPDQQCREEQDPDGRLDEQEPAPARRRRPVLRHVAHAARTSCPT